ncbi:MAG: pseudaminic acid cytidylyltransferase [Flavobacteriaceae bacterium]
MTRLAIIPARGGSKRIPKKNIKPFLGKPIIAYSIEAALQSNLFDEVMVSTDNTEIAEIAKKYGAKVPFLRSHKNANDFATLADVIQEVLLEYKKKKQFFDQVCCILSTAALITKEKLGEAHQKMIDNDFDSVFPIVEFSFPIQRSLKIIENRVEITIKEHINTRSQDLESRYHDAGQFYWINTISFLDQKKILMSKTGGLIISELQAQDIDSDTDWKLAELKYKLYLDEKNNTF